MDMVRSLKVGKDAVRYLTFGTGFKVPDPSYEVQGELGPAGFQRMVMLQLALYINRRIVSVMNPLSSGEMEQAMVAF
jgi:hypothetical protein